MNEGELVLQCNLIQAEMSPMQSRVHACWGQVYVASGGMSVQPDEHVPQVCWQKPDMNGSYMHFGMVSERRSAQHGSDELNRAVGSPDTSQTLSAGQGTVSCGIFRAKQVEFKQSTCKAAVSLLSYNDMCTASFRTHVNIDSRQNAAQWPLTCCWQVYVEEGGMSLQTEELEAGVPGTAGPLGALSLGTQ